MKMDHGTYILLRSMFRDMGLVITLLKLGVAYQLRCAIDYNQSAALA